MVANYNAPNNLSMLIYGKIKDALQKLDNYGSVQLFKYNLRLAMITSEEIVQIYTTGTFNENENTSREVILTKNYCLPCHSELLKKEKKSL